MHVSARSLALASLACAAGWTAQIVGASGFDCTPWQVHGFHMEMTIEAALENIKLQRYETVELEGPAEEQRLTANRILAVSSRKKGFRGLLFFDGDDRLVSYLADFGISHKKKRQVVDRYLYNLFVERFGEASDESNDPYVDSWPLHWEKTFRGRPYEVKTWHSNTCDAHLSLAEGRVPGFTQIYAVVNLQRITYLLEQAARKPEPPTD